MNDTEHLIAAAGQLKPLSPVAAQILEVVDQETVDFAQIAKIVQYDPVVTANLLRLCNSAYFGLARTVNSVREAISLLGLDRIVELSLLSVAGENLKKTNPGYGLQKNDLWRNAVGSALVAKDVARRIGNPHSGLVFTAALLKDIGKVVLDHAVADGYEQIQALVRDKNYSFGKAEKAVIGISHAELGGQIAQKWNFSKRLQDLIAYHHRPEEKGYDDQELCLVYFSDLVCLIAGIGGGADGLSYEFYPRVLETLQLSATDLEQIIADLGARLAEVEELVQAA